MKWIKRIFIILLIIVVLILLAGLYFIKTFDANKYKDIVTAKITEQIGRDVTIENIALNFSHKKGLEIKLDELFIADEINQEGGYLARIDSVALGIDVMKFIKTKEIAVYDVLVKKPELFLFKGIDGNLNIQNIGAKEQAVGAVSDVQNKPSAKPRETQQEQAPIIDISVNSIKVVDGRLDFVEEASPDAKIVIADIDLSVEQFSLDRFFTFDAALSAFKSKQNVFMSGEAKLDPVNGAVILKNTSLSTDLKDYELKAIVQAVPALEQIKTIEQLEGKIKVDIIELALSQTGFDRLKINIGAEDGLVKIAGIPIPIDQVLVLGNINESDLKFDEMEFYYGQGKIQIDAEIRNYLLSPVEDFSISMSDIRTEEVLGSAGLPIEIEGVINGYLSGQAVGFTPEAIQTSLISEGKIEMTKGLLKDINVLKMVLSNLSFIPNLAEKVESKLPPTYKEKLKQKDTPLNLVRSDLKWINNKLNFTNALVDADGFLLDLNGNVDLEQNLVLNATFTIPVELSQLMVASTPELSALLNEDNLIQIPFKPYRGKLDKFTPLPDVGDLTRKALQTFGKEEAKKAIFKALDWDVEPQPDAAIEAALPDGQAPEPETKPPEQQLIEGLLDSIFK